MQSSEMDDNIVPMESYVDGVFVGIAKGKEKIRKNSILILLGITVLLLSVIIALIIVGIVTIRQIAVTINTNPATTTTATTISTSNTNKEAFEGKRPSYAMQLMEENIGRFKDPCHDFYAFACEGVMNSTMNNRNEQINQKFWDFLNNLKIRQQINHKSLKYFQEQYNQCNNTICGNATVNNFANVLGLAVMDEFNLWNLAKSILNDTKKAFLELIEQNDFLAANGKSIAIDLMKMTFFHIGLPKDFASWDVLDRIYEYGFNNATDGKPIFTQIDDWYLEIFGRKPNQ